MSQYVLIFIAGMAGSFHCAGMCGGFACGLAPDQRGKYYTLLRHLTYNAGRGITYTFLGSLAGAAGSVLLFDGGIEIVQRILAAIAGVFIVLMAAQISGRLASLHLTGLAPAGAFAGFAPGMRRLLTHPGIGAPLTFGLVNGFLPCPLVYAFIARAAATGTVAHGIATMGAFALGTFPIMLIMGALGPVFRYQWRRRGVQIAALFLLLLGVITMVRAFLPMSMHMV